MAIKLFLLLFISSCGKDVLISNELKDASQLSSPKTYQQGTIIRSEPLGTLVGHEISTRSSHQAQEIIRTLPLGSRLQVQFQAKIDKNEIIISEIKTGP